MTTSSLCHLSFILFYLSIYVLSSHPVLDIPLSQINAPKPSFTITEVLDLNGGATLMPMPNAPTLPPIDPLALLPTSKPNPKAGEIAEIANAKPLRVGEIAERPNLKDQALSTEALETQKASSSPSFLDDAEFKKAVLNSTNTIRKLHSAPALTWNDTLSLYATNYSTRCRPQSSHSPFGETFASSSDNVTSAIESWNAQLHSLKIDLSNLTTLEKDLSPKKLAKSLKKAKAFTQLIWKNSTQIGCGRTLCGGQNGVQGWLVVCEFDPKGNVIGKFGENVQVSTGTGGGNAGGNGQISAGKTRPNAGAIGEAKSSGTVDRVQVWCVFIVVWLVLGAILS